MIRNLLNYQSLKMIPFKLKACLLVFVISLLLRFIWLFFIVESIPNGLGGVDWELNPSKQELSSAGLVSPDFNQVYDVGGLMISEGKGFSDKEGQPTAYVGPGYSIFLAGIYKLNGHDINMVRYSQIVLDSLTAVLIFLIAFSTFSRNISLMSAFTYAFYPLAIYQSTLLITEALFTFLLTMFLLFSLPIKNKQTGLLQMKPFLFFVSGLVLGLAALTRPNGIVVIAALFFILFFLPLYDKKRLAYLYFFSLLGLFLTVFPWIWRNYYFFDKFIPISSIIFHTFEEAEGVVQSNVWDYLYKKLSRIFQNTGEVIDFIFSAPFYIWYKTNSGTQDLYIALIQYPILGVSILGMIKSIKKYIISKYLFFVFIIFFVSLLLVTKNALARYIVPIMPIIIIFFAIGLEQIKDLYFKHLNKRVEKSAS